MQLQWCLWSKNRKSLFLDLRSSNPQKKRDWLENPPWMKTYFLLNMGIFQPVMLVFGGDIHRKEYSDMRNCRIWDGKPLCKLHVLLSNTDLVLPRCPWHDGHYEGCGLCKLFQPPRSFQMERLPPNRTHHGCSTIYDMERLKICCEKIVSICETTPSLDIMCNPFCFVVFHQRHETKTLKANKFIVSETWAWRVSGGTWISPGLPYQILAGFNAWLDCDCEGVNPDTFERSIRTDGIWT